MTTTNLTDRSILFVAQGFGLGRIPVAPGTFGTLAGLPLIAVMAGLGFRTIPGATAFYLMALTLVSIWVADRAEQILGQKDPGSIVIDEMVGFCVAMCLVPITPLTLVAGFAAFRCFDIIKPLPVKYFERQFTGGASVVLDDIMAGLMAALVLKIIYMTGMMM